MIRIEQATANLVVITTTEKGSASHYLFRFFNLSTNLNVYCVADDTSPYPNRYNAFTITEQASPTPINAEVEMATGEWKYYVYANSSATNLNPSGLTLLESGMCVVTGTVVTTPTYSNTAIYTVYEG